MDLETLGKRLESRQYYRNKDSFIKDVVLIINNARTYNKAESLYYRYATSLEEYITPYLEELSNPNESELKKYEKHSQNKAEPKSRSSEKVQIGRASCRERVSSPV